MKHKNTAPTGVFQQSNKADFAVENKEETAAPFGIGSALSAPSETAKPKKAKKAEAEVVETEVKTEEVAAEVVVEESTAAEESADSK